MKLVKTFADIAKFVLWSDSPVDDTKRARMQIGLRDGNPRFNVYTGGKGKESMINFGMNIVDTVTIMNILKDIAKGDKGNVITARALGNVYKDGQQTKEVRDLSRLHIGKSKEGIVFLSVTSEERPKIVFSIQPSQYMLFQDRDKQPIDPGYISEKMAIGMADLILESCAALMLEYTREEYTSGVKTTVDIAGNDSNGKPTGRTPQKTTQGKFDDLDELNL